MKIKFKLNKNNNVTNNQLIIKITVFYFFFICVVNGTWTPLHWKAEEKCDMCIPDDLIVSCYNESEKTTPNNYKYTQAWACCKQEKSCTKYTLENDVSNHITDNRREGQLLLETARLVSNKVCCHKKSIFNKKEQWILWLKGHHDCKPHSANCYSKVHTIICDPEYCFRTITGHCNNLKDKSIGAAEQCFARAIPASYSDGIHKPRLTRKGTLLKNCRDISVSTARAYKNTIGLKISECDIHPNVLLTGISLLLSYDVSNTISYVPKNDKTYKENCCSCDEKCMVSNYMNGYACLPIKVSSKDKFFGEDGCLYYGRSAVVPNNQCSIGPAEQACTVTHYIDLSYLYGSTSETNHHIRSKINGKIALDEHKILPQCCDGDSYLTGDARVTNWPQTTIIASILYNKHNYLANKLKSINFKWNSEALYQISKKILTAWWQKIIYNEYFPIILGNKKTIKYKLVCDIGTDCNCYNQKIDPRTLNEIGNGIFVYFELWMPNRLWAGFGTSFKKLKLNEVFNNVKYCKSNFDSLLNGMMNQQLGRDSFALDLCNFKHDGKSKDLLAYTIMKGRDHGIAPYVDYIKLLHGTPVKCWEDLHKFISPENCEVLKRNYKSYRDIDFIVGVLLENLKDKLLVPPTVAILLAHQANAWKCGDKHHYTEKNEFTKEQRNEIDKLSLASLLCTHKKIKEIPKNPLLIPSEKNPMVSCEKIYSINLSVFKNCKY